LVNGLIGLFVKSFFYSNLRVGCGPVKGGSVKKCAKLQVFSRGPARGAVEVSMMGHAPDAVRAVVQCCLYDIHQGRV